MLRRKIVGSAAAIVLCMGLNIPAYGSGIPVFDGANFAEAIKDAIMQNKQLAETVKQYNQLVQTYNQMVQNARALGNMAQLANLIDFGQTLINSQSSKLLFQTIYGINPNSPIYEAQARAILERDFGVPQSNTTMRPELLKYFNQADAQKLLDDRMETERDSKELVKLFKNFKKTKDQDDKIIENAEIIHNSMPTGADSLNATMQFMALQNKVLIEQNQQRANWLKQQQELEIRKETRRLEKIRKAEELRIRSLERRKQFRQEAFTDISVWSSAQ